MRKVLAAFVLVLVGLAAGLPHDVQTTPAVDMVVSEAAGLPMDDDQITRRIAHLEQRTVGEEQKGTEMERIASLEEVLLGAQQTGQPEDRLSTVEAALKASKVTTQLKRQPETNFLEEPQKVQDDAMPSDDVANAEKKVEQAEHVEEKLGDLVSVSQKAKAESAGAHPADYCDKKTQMCYYDSNKECDSDKDCGPAPKPPPPPPPPPPPKVIVKKVYVPPPTKHTGCDVSKGMCYNDDQQECSSDADCVFNDCKNAPSQWWALLLQIVFAPFGAGFGYIGRWGMTALYLNATFLPCLLSCLIVCCFPSKLEDEAYRMPAAVWIMVFWGCLQIAMYIWSVVQFANNAFLAGYPYEGCHLRDDWKW